MFDLKVADIQTDIHVDYVNVKGRSKLSAREPKISGGGVPPTPKITTPSNFPYPHCLFTVTLLQSYGDI